jgi:WhiB family redox-sensing transcriptional regulator
MQILTLLATRAADWTGARCGKPDIDPEDMYPHPTDTAGIEYAKDVCEACPLNIREKCLDDALATGRTTDFGMRGGLTEDERRSLRRRRSNAAKRQQKREQAQCA